MNRDNLEAIRTFDGDPIDWLRLAVETWDQGYGRVILDGNAARFATGGWGENEMVIEAMKANVWMYSKHWVSSHRGGLHVFEVCE